MGQYKLTLVMDLETFVLLELILVFHLQERKYIHRKKKAIDNI